MIEAHQASPNKTLEVKQVFEDGDRVITHSKVVKQTPIGMTIAAVHIFKFENNQVVELWDLGQVVSKDSPNENGLLRWYTGGSCT